MNKVVEEGVIAMRVIYVAKSKSVLKRKLIQVGADLKDWMILEVKRKREVAIEQ